MIGQNATIAIQGATRTYACHYIDQIARDSLCCDVVSLFWILSQREDVLMRIGWWRGGAGYMYFCWCGLGYCSWGRWWLWNAKSKSVLYSWETCRKWKLLLPKQFCEKTCCLEYTHQIALAFLDVRAIVVWENRAFMWIGKGLAHFTPGERIEKERAGNKKRCEGLIISRVIGTLEMIKRENRRRILDSLNLTYSLYLT